MYRDSSYYGPKDVVSKDVVPIIVLWAAVYYGLAEVARLIDCSGVAIICSNCQECDVVS